MSRSSHGAVAENKMTTGSTTMKQNQAIPQWVRLLWKDARTVAPLWLSIIASILIANLAIIMVRVSTEASEGSLLPWCSVAWVVLPGLFAFGAPAMLVATEEDSGTLSWLRILPIPWSLIAHCKLAIAVIGLASLWALATSVFWLHSLKWSSSTVDDVFSWGALSAHGYFLALLLLMGFVCSYLFRSSLLGLMAVMPIYMVIAIPLGDRLNAIPLTGATVAGLAFLLAVVWGVQQTLAWRRLVPPVGSWHLLGDDSMPIYQYRFSEEVVLQKPSPWKVLLWQQARQSGWPTLAIVAFCGILVAIPFALDHTLAGSRNGWVFLLGGMGPAWFLLGATWLGTLAFYGDSVRRRCQFLSDRGISAEMIWVSRVIPQLIAFVLMLWLIFFVITIFASASPWRSPNDLSTNLVFISVAFAFGPVVAQWTDRPAMAFLAAPALAFIVLACAMGLMATVDPGVTNINSVGWIAPILLFASWKLRRRWLDGAVGPRFSAQVITFAGLAIVTPTIWNLLSQWR